MIKLTESPWFWNVDRWTAHWFASDLVRELRELFPRADIVVSYSDTPAFVDGQVNDADIEALSYIRIHIRKFQERAKVRQRSEDARAAATAARRARNVPQLHPYEDRYDDGTTIVDYMGRRYRNREGERWPVDRFDCLIERPI